MTANIMDAYLYHQIEVVKRKFKDVSMMAHHFCVREVLKR